MKITGHGNGIAIALAGLAVVLAATGTAYAVTTSNVRIADAKKPTQVARVDATGRLLTGSSLSTLDFADYLLGYQANMYTNVTSPTTASLALTRIRLANPASNPGTGNQQIGLYQVDTVNATTCGTNLIRNLGNYNLAPGQESVDQITPALLVRPKGTARYCLALYTVVVPDAPLFYVTYSVTGYTYSGSYTGTGTSAVTGATVRRSPRISR